MLYIEKIIVSDGFTSAKSVPCLYYNHLTRMRYTIELVMRDTENGGVSKLTNAPRVVRICSDTVAQEAFENSLRRYNPYGFVIDSEMQDGSYYAMLVAIDKPSLEFLGYVDEVIPYDGRGPDKLLYHLRSMEHPFFFWDEQRSLISIDLHNSSDLGFPLFQGLCLAKLDWFENRLFIRADHSDDAIWYEILFSDMTKARAMLSKAALRGYDPVGQNLDKIKKM